MGHRWKETADGLFWPLLPNHKSSVTYHNTSITLVYKGYKQCCCFFSKVPMAEKGPKVKCGILFLLSRWPLTLSRHLWRRPCVPTTLIMAELVKASNYQRKSLNAPSLPKGEIWQAGHGCSALLCCLFFLDLKLNLFLLYGLKVRGYDILPLQK